MRKVEIKLKNQVANQKTCATDRNFKNQRQFKSERKPEGRMRRPRHKLLLEEETNLTLYEEHRGIVTSGAPATGGVIGANRECKLHPTSNIELGPHRCWSPNLDI